MALTTKSDDVPLDARQAHEIIGRLVGRKRISSGLSQAEVAERIGISRTRLSRIESGRLRLLFSEAALLARLYGVGLDELVPMTMRRSHGSRPDPGLPD